MAPLPSSGLEIPALMVNAMILCREGGAYLCSKARSQSLNLLGGAVMSFLASLVILSWFDKASAEQVLS